MSEPIDKDELVRVAKELMDIARTNQFGNVILDMRHHNGSYSARVASVAKSVKYKNENAAAVADVLSFMRKKVNSKATGEYTFTLELLKGSIDRITYDDNDKKRLV